MCEESRLGTFCLVWLPAPGHSVIMSSLASVFVAKAKATPEKVVPCIGQRLVSMWRVVGCAHKINADDQLCFASVAALDLSRTHVLAILTHLLYLLRRAHLTIARAAIAWWLLSHLRVCAAVTSTGINRRWVVRSHLLLPRRGWGHGRLSSTTGVLIAGRSAEATLLRVHGGQAGLAGVGRRGIRDGGGAVGGGSRACGGREIGVALAFGTKAETLESRAHSIGRWKASE